MHPNPTPGAAAATPARALAVAVGWMLVVQLGCVLLWDAGWLTRAGAVAHWLALGVLPPAIALCTWRGAAGAAR